MIDPIAFGSIPAERGRFKIKRGTSDLLLGAMDDAALVDEAASEAEEELSACPCGEPSVRDGLCDPCWQADLERRVLDAAEARPERWARARKDDAAKPRTDLLSPDALMGLARVLAFGAEKYEENNWRKGLAWSRVIGAAQRHLLAFQAGEDVDPESGLPHVDHLLCCCMFLSEYQKRATGTDDRWRWEQAVG